MDVDYTRKLTLTVYICTVYLYPEDSLPRHTAYPHTTQPSTPRHTHMAEAFRTHLTQPTHAMDGHTYNTHNTHTTHAMDGYTYNTHTTHTHNSLLQTMVSTSSPQVTTVPKYIPAQNPM